MKMKSWGCLDKARVGQILPFGRRAGVVDIWGKILQFSE
jgi:hypothetical protein